MDKARSFTSDFHWSTPRKTKRVRRRLDRAEHVLRLGHELGTGRTRRAGHRHLDLDVRLAFDFLEIDDIDQSKVHDVDEQLGIDHLLERLADGIF